MKNFYSLFLKTKTLNIFALVILCILFYQKAYAQPTANAGPNQTICFGSSITIGGAPTATGANPPFTYSWSPSSGLSSTTVSNPIASPSVTTTYTVTVTDALSFTSGSAVTVTVNSLPNANPSSNSPTCDGGVISLMAASVAGGTYSWAGPNGFTATMQNPTINPATTLASGTYTLTVTAMGCSNVNSTNVMVNAIPTSTISSSTNVTCNGLANGSATVSASGGTAPYLYYWDDALNQTTTTATGLIAGNYIAYVSDANGCNTQSAITILEPTALSLSVPSSTSVCFGDSTTINTTVTGGTTPYSYTWDEGGVYYYTPSITIAPSTGTSFTLTITDANGCTANGNPSVAVNPLTDISGYIGYSAGAFINGGTVVLYEHQSTFVSFDTTQTTLIDGSGLYNFSSVPTGDYIVKAFPFASFPDVNPTYLGDVYLWDFATIVNHGCITNNNGNNIQMIEPPAISGPGVLSGTITEGPGFQRLDGDPIPGIDVKLGRNPGGQLVTNTQTNPFGQFTFNNIPVNIPGEYYTIYVDIPGLGRDSLYNITVDASNYIYNQLDHGVDSNSVYPIYPIVTNINNASKINNSKFEIYPNPSKKIFNVSYSLSNDSDVMLEVYNVLGIKEKTIINTKQQAVDYSFVLDEELASGVYFINLSVNNKNNIIRIIKTE